MLRSHGDILALNGLRGMAAILVILCHLPIPTIVQKAHPYLRPILEFGWVGVPIYFILSGYLITWLALKEKKEFNDLSLKFFFIRRILRLWPIYILTCTLGLWIYRFPEFDEIAATPNWLLPLATFTTNIAITLHQEHFGALGAFWTLALEEQFYLMAGILLKKMKLNSLLLVFILLIFCCTIWRFFPLRFNYFLHYRIQFPVSLLSILLGCVLALYQEKYGLNLNITQRKILEVGVLVIGITILLWEYPFSLEPYRCGLLMFAADGFSLGLIILCLCEKGVISNVMSFRFLRHIGKLSLCIYAMNIPVIFFYIYFKEHYFKTSVILQQYPQWRFLWDTGMIFFINMVIASIWQYFEEPIAKLRYAFRPSKQVHINMALIN